MVAAISCHEEERWGRTVGRESTCGSRSSAWWQQRVVGRQQQSDLAKPMWTQPAAKRLSNAQRAEPKRRRFCNHPPNVRPGSKVDHLKQSSIMVGKCVWTWQQSSWLWMKYPCKMHMPSMLWTKTNLPPASNTFGASVRQAPPARPKPCRLETFLYSCNIFTC